MPQSTPNRWPLAIGLIVVALGLLAWSLFSATRDPAIPTEPVSAGSSPAHFTAEEEAYFKQHGGLPKR